MTRLFIILLTTESCISQPSKSRRPENGTPQAFMQILIIKATDLKTGSDYSTPVISNAQKFILPVPAFGPAGEPLVYPPTHPKAGLPILSYEGKPVGERGIVFFNAKDQSWQASASDGQSVNIINEVTQEQANKLDHAIKKLQPNPDKLNLVQLKQVLAFARETLNLKDVYNSNRSFIQEKMTPVLTNKGAKDNRNEIYGLKKRDDRDVNQAIYIPGAFIFEGPAASPQEFTNGGVIIEQGGKMRGVQPTVFLRTYTLASGLPIQSISEDIRMQMIN